MSSTVKRVNIGMATCGIAMGADKVFDIFKQLTPPEVTIHKVGCLGFCPHEPIVDVVSEDGTIVRYQKIDEVKAKEIIEQHLKNNQPIVSYLFQESFDILEKQTRVVFRNAGLIDPEKIEDYQTRGGYEGLKKALEMDPDDIINEIQQSELRGAGGAGFPTGLKWTFTRREQAKDKYMICNANEGDPGVYIDRLIMESDPHSVIEGMIIGAYATGCNHGVIYIRMEYPLAYERLNIATKQARFRRFLGKRILGKPFDFDIQIKRGAGAFIVGEETALMASIMGKRGHPRTKPPFPGQSGLFEKPSNINNVKTLANVPWIISQGWQAFHSIGLSTGRGTSMFCLSGDIKEKGMIEVPMGTSLREIVYDYAKGMSTDKPFKAAQVDGPTGEFLPESHLDVSVHSGGIVVLDTHHSMVKLARFFLEYSQKESCGKCVPCRIGTRAMLVILDKLLNGIGQQKDLQLLEELANTVSKASLCGLGQTAPKPIQTTLKYFRDEYMSLVSTNKFRVEVV